jgi:hypothetical protein
MEKQQKAMEKAMQKRKSEDGDEVPFDEIVKSKGEAEADAPKESKMGRGMNGSMNESTLERAMNGSIDASDIADVIARMGDGGAGEAIGEEALKELGAFARAMGRSTRPKPVQALGAPSWRPHKEGTAATPEAMSFLEAAGVSRFSICFRDQGRSGALRLDPPKASSKPLISVGMNHWGLDFQGVSVGSKSAKVKFCSPDSKAKGMETACGGIPDSGTTLLMAPKSHIEPLFEDICDNWKRCRTVVDEGLGKVKAEVFQMLMSECAEWREEEGLEELPPIYLHVAGEDGTTQSLRLDAASYIFETVEEIVEEVTDSALGFALPVPTGKNRTVCMPGISGHDMDTELNGPVWILGSPLFHQYNVGYELDQKTFKSSITFEELAEDGVGCGCEDELALRGATSPVERVERRPRELHGPPRVSRIDVSLGL